MFYLKKDRGCLCLEFDGAPVPVDPALIEQETPDGAAVATARPMPLSETIAHRIIGAQIEMIERCRDGDEALIQTLRSFLSPAMPTRAQAA